MTDFPSSPVTATLKPCPFCGCPARLKQGCPGSWFVQCERCMAASNDVGYEHAIDIWNTRAVAQPAPSSPETETLEFFYARDLLVSFVKEHCDPVPEWKPNGDLMGILMQFDNALTVVRSIKAGLDPKQSSDLAQSSREPVEQECFDMLWQWFTERRGAEDMRANEINGGLSAADFKQMLDEHEAALSDTSTSHEGGK